MKIAAVTLDYPPHRFIGSEMATHAMLRHLAARGHDVTVYTAEGISTFEWEGVKVEPGWALFFDAARDDAVVVAHAEFGKRIARVPAPLIGITHNARVGMRSALPLAPWSLIVHNAEATAAELADAANAPHIVVHPPVDWRDYDVDRTGADCITLVNVTGEKGSDTFYELAGRMPDRRFLGVLGGWGEPDVRDMPNVELIPATSDMRSVYARTRVLLMPSEHESWGRVAVEAMSSGIPVVATDLPGPREAIGDGGFLVELDWWDRYEQIINMLDDHDAYAERSMAASARARALDPVAELDLFAKRIEAIGNGRCNDEYWEETA